MGSHYLPTCSLVTRCRQQQDHELHLHQQDYHLCCGASVHFCSVAEQKVLMAVQGWNLVYIRATPHHTGLIPSRWTQLQQDVQPFVGTNLIPYRYVTTYTSPCNMKDPIQATWTTSTLSPYHCHLALLVLVRVSFDVVLILDPYQTPLVMQQSLLPLIVSYARGRVTNWILIKYIDHHFLLFRMWQAGMETPVNIQNLKIQTLSSLFCFLSTEKSVGSIGGCYDCMVT